MATAKQIQEAIAKALEELESPRNMRKYAEEAARIVKVRTRLGYGVDREGGQKKKLKALSDSYVEQRKKSKLHSETTPKRSNLTRSGQLLDSYGPTKVARGEAFVGPGGSRNDGKTNEEIAQYVSDQGRAFNNFSRLEAKQISDMISKDLDALLNKSLTRIK